MNIVLLQTQLSLQDIEHLLKEFPHYLFLSFSEATYKNLSPENWAQVEILYGSRLTAEELSKAHHLRWIHSPAKDLNKLCLTDIQQHGNIILTSIKEENQTQIGEFVMSGILAFSKNLFHWVDTNKHPNIVWNSKWRDNMWSLKGKQLLQIGLDRGGTEITRLAEKLEMRVLGMQGQKSFHPHCHQMYSYKDLHSIPPFADIISLNLPKSKEFEGWIGKVELSRMKEGSILILLGDPRAINEPALIEMAPKFRGILIDAAYEYPIKESSPLWTLPNTLITPGVSPRPKTLQGQAFASFRFNLRQYIHGNFKDMRNVLNSDFASVPL